jgi:hypothetical protein
VLPRGDTGLSVLLKAALDRVQWPTRHATTAGGRSVLHRASSTRPSQPRKARTTLASSPASVLSNQICLLDDEGRVVESYESQKQAAEDLGISAFAVHKCINFKIPTAMGYRLHPWLLSGNYPRCPHGVKTISLGLSWQRARCLTMQKATRADQEAEKHYLLRQRSASDLFFLSPTSSEFEDDERTNEDIIVADLLAKLVDQVVCRDRILYMPQAAARGPSTTYAFKSAYQSLNDRGMFEIPSATWAPLGSHEASETEVMLYSLLILEHLKGAPEEVGAFYEEVLSWESDSDSNAANETQMVARTGAGRVISRATSLLVAKRHGVCQTISAVMRQLRESAEKLKRQPLYASCPIPATHLSLVVPPSAAEIAT